MKKIKVGIINALTVAELEEEINSFLNDLEIQNFIEIQYMSETTACILYYCWGENE